MRCAGRHTDQQPAVAASPRPNCQGMWTICLYHIWANVSLGFGVWGFSVELCAAWTHWILDHHLGYRGTLLTGSMPFPPYPPWCMPFLPYTPRSMPPLPHPPRSMTLLPYPPRSMSFPPQVHVPAALLTGSMSVLPPPKDRSMPTPPGPRLSYPTLP